MDREEQNVFMEQALRLLEEFEPILDMVDGYRAKLISRGYSEPVAEAMVIDFHHMCIEQILKVPLTVMDK